jgi:hypothetical protein
LERAGWTAPHHHQVVSFQIVRHNLTLEHFLESTDRARNPLLMARAELFNAEVIAGWMFLNHVLSVYGFLVINGFSDLLTPFLEAAGAEAGATGWWSNLRTFSLERFSPATGDGRTPTERCALLNRITYYELDILRRRVRSVLNRLGYPPAIVRLKSAGA